MRPALSRNVAASVVNACAAVATSLLDSPAHPRRRRDRRLRRVDPGAGAGPLRLDSRDGAGPGVQRFTAFARGRRDEEALSRIAVTTLVAYALLGVVAGLVLFAIAPLLVDLFDLPRRLQHDAEEMFRILGGALALTLLAAGAANVAQGLERFGMLALSTAAGAVAFLAAVVVLARRARPPRAGRCRLHRPGRDADRPQRRSGPGGDPPTPHARARAPAALRLLRSPSGHGVFRARQLAERQAGCRPRRLARHRGPARHRRAVRGRREVARRAPPSPPSTRPSRTSRAAATRRGCTLASSSSTGCGCSASWAAA